MKPLGTITAYLPLVDSHTSGVILEEMDAAENYADFVKRFCDRVCREEVSEYAVYLASHHAFKLDAADYLARIAEKYGEVLLVRPILFTESAQLGDPKGYARVREAADAVLASDPPDWLAIEMYGWKLMTALFDYPAAFMTSETFDHVEFLISRCQNPAFFGAYWYSLLSAFAACEGDHERSTEMSKRAHALAVECNDQYLLSKMLQSRASDLDIKDVEESKRLIRAAGELMKSLGDLAGLADVIRQLGAIETVSGRHIAAIQHYTEALRIQETLGVPTVFTMIGMADPYFAIGDYESALAWARMAESKGDMSSSHIVSCRLQQARALILLGRLQEARELIDSSREAVYRSGREVNLRHLRATEGILEIAQGDYSAAFASLEEALEIAERCLPESVWNCLYHLARAEVLAAVDSKKLQSDEGEGYWLARLENSARSEGRRGLLGKALLLKAELYLARHQYQEASTVLQEVGVLACELGLEYLHKDLDRLLKRFDDLTEQKLQR